jgi:hypothetical protein
MEVNPTLSLGETACTLFFGSIACAYCYLDWRYNDNGQPENAGGKSTGRIGPLDNSISSVKNALGMAFELGVILLFSWCCENVPLWPHDKKFGSDFIFWGLFAVFMCIALFTLKKNKNDDDTLLNREQTEEWKGWMQYLFLAYHYFHYGAVYNYVRVFISCYVWMTGFGNVSFFYIKQDFGLLRFLQMMWRLNFLVFFLCLVHQNTYILYYICPLHTFYFLVTYLAMRVNKGLNIEWPTWLRIKFIALFGIIYLVWEHPYVFYVVWSPFLSSKKVIGARNGTLYEWYFRSALDHYSAIFGMAFAINFPTLVAWLKRAEAQKAGAEKLLKLLLCAPLVLLMYFWCTEITNKPKIAYNGKHPYFFWIPLLTYVAVRNSFPFLRKYHSSLLVSMGKVTLETYLMQHHVWLTENAKAVLVLIPGYPLLNLAVTTLIYMYVSNRLFRITIGLRAMLLPNDLSKTLHHLSWLAVGMALCFSVAKGVIIFFSNTSFYITLFILATVMGICLMIFIDKKLEKGHVAEAVRTPQLTTNLIAPGTGLIVLTFVFLASHLRAQTNYKALTVAQEIGPCSSALGVGMWEAKDVPANLCPKNSICFPGKCFSWLELTNKQKTMCRSQPMVQAERFYRPTRGDGWNTFIQPQTITIFGGESSKKVQQQLSAIIQSEQIKVHHSEGESEGFSLWKCESGKISTVVKFINYGLPCKNKSETKYRSKIQSLQNEANAFKLTCPSTTLIWVAKLDVASNHASDSCGVYNSYARSQLGELGIYLNHEDLLRGPASPGICKEFFQTLSMTVLNQIRFEQLKARTVNFGKIPHSSHLALPVLGVFLCIIIFADNFLFFGHLSFLLVGVKPISVEESYEEFHKKNGMTKRPYQIVTST